MAGRTIEDVCSGHNGIETRMPVAFSEGVVKRGMSLHRAAREMASSSSAASQKR